MLGKSTYLDVIPRQSTQKPRKIAITDMQGKPETFFIVQPACQLYLPLHKFSFSLQFIGER